MKTEKLPLLEILTDLREKYGFSLGIEEYLVVVNFLRAGIVVNSRNDVEDLCCLVWAKSLDETAVVKDLLEQMWSRIKIASPRVKEEDSIKVDNSSDESLSTQDQTVIDSPQNVEKEIPQKEDIANNFSESKDSSNAESRIDATIKGLDPPEIVRSLRHRERDSRRPKFSVRPEYFPVTKRQMSQNWRCLRRYVRQGAATELDVAATVQSISRQGLVGEPILVPPRTNQATLMLLIDQNGSMMPFHGLSKQLVETANRGGRFSSVKVFYFHNCPDTYLYEHPSLAQPKSLKSVLAEASEDMATLIVSDAGAARDSFNDDRIELTETWLQELRQSIKNIAWINPMPLKDWQGNSAEAIAHNIPMFEMSKLGMGLAVDVLRGRYLAVRKGYSWLR